MSEDYIALKWGSLKSWSLSTPEQKTLLERFFEIGANCSAILHKNTDEQKEIICQLIDSVTGDIYLDWDDKEVTKSEAKKYVMEYGIAQKTEDNRELVV